MSLDKDEDRSEFIRLIEELSKFTEQMDPYEQKFVVFFTEHIRKFEDKIRISESQLQFARRLYERYL